MGSKLNKPTVSAPPLHKDTPAIQPGPQRLNPRADHCVAGASFRKILLTPSLPFCLLSFRGNAASCRWPSLWVTLVPTFLLFQAFFTCVNNSLHSICSLRGNEWFLFASWTLDWWDNESGRLNNRMHLSWAMSLRLGWVCFSSALRSMYSNPKTVPGPPLPVCWGYLIHCLSQEAQGSQGGRGYVDPAHSLISQN